MPGRNTVIRLTRLLALGLLIVVFGWSGVYKALDPAGFSLSLFRYHLLPYGAVNIAALWITGLEITCAFVLLFIPRLRKAAILLILSMLIAFSVGIAINLIRGSHIACGCFSSSPMAHPVGWISFVKNLGLILVAACALITHPATANIDS